MLIRMADQKAAPSWAIICAALLICGCRGEAPDHITVKPEVPAHYRDDPSIVAQHFADYEVLSLRPSSDPGHFSVLLKGKSGVVKLDDVDLRPFVPRVPAITKGNELLTEIALQQRELNRFDTTMPRLADGTTPHLANNCLRSGLWEFYLTRPGSTPGTDEKFYHSWFEFPSDLYARLFIQETGLDYASYKSLLAHYARLEGLPIDLDFVRKTLSQTVVPLGRINFHENEQILLLPEQLRKLKLVVSRNLNTYAEFHAAANQPVQLASFRPPGLYSTKRPVKFDFSFLASPTGVTHRVVKEPAANAKSLDELEINFAHGLNWKLAMRWPFVRITRGLKLVIGGIDLTALPIIRGDSPGDDELTHLTFGFGTPEVYGSYDFRLAEFEREPSTYLLLLDRDNKYVDNHTTGLDRVYLPRRASGSIELYIVAYEREAIVAHWTLPKV